MLDSDAGELSLGVRLLADLRGVFGERDVMPTAEVLAALAALDDAPWADMYGKPIDAPRDLTIEGDLAYIDAWVVKYHDKLVETGSPLGSTSICLFRRLFGETQKPADGFPLDRNGGFEARPSGNAVSLEDEMLKVANNQMDYQAATALYTRGLGMLRTAFGKR